MIDIDLIKERLSKEYEAAADRVDLFADDDTISAEFERGRFEALGDALALLDGMECAERIDARL